MKLNLVIDASGIFYRSLFSVGNYGVKKGERLLEGEESKAIFMRKLATDFAALVKSVENVNRVVVCLDSSSWRKKIEIEEGAYKGTRVKDESNIDWNSFFELTSEFSEILKSRGYIISKINDAEADDLLYLWSRKLNEADESVVLITGDRDLHQCIQFNSNSFTIALDPVSQRRKIILTQEALDSQNEKPTFDEELFLNPDTWCLTHISVLENLLSNNEHIILDPVDVATKKVILGDGGDAIPSIITWKDKKDPTKLRMLTDNKLEKAKMYLQPFTWKDLQSGKITEDFVKAINQVMKMEFDHIEIQSKINRNIKLVVLEKEIIPQSIQEEFELTVNEINSSPVNMARDKILEDTKWWSKKPIVPSTYDIKVEKEDDEPIKIIKKNSPNALF